MQKQKKYSIGRSISRPKNETLWGFFLIAPTMIGLFVLNVIPIIQTFFLSFFKSGDFGRGNQFVGWENFQTLIADPQVFSAIRNTLFYTVLVVPFSIVIGLVLAAVLQKGIRAKGIYRTIYFIPMVATPAAVTMVWRWLYNRDFGLINQALSPMISSPIDWINNPQTAMFSIVLIGVWSLIGYNLVLFMAGLQEIPQDYYEAMDIDGASSVQKFIYITLPLISPTMFFVAVTTIIQSMQVFDVIFMMIKVTSPAYEKTVSLVYLFYNNAFRYSNKGYGSALVIVLLFLILIITVVQLKLQKKWVIYE